MADVRLHRDDADGYLPDVCMCCGEQASGNVIRKMAWCPPWVGVLILFSVIPYIIVASIMTQRARVQAPLCDQHQGHWFNRAMLMWGSFFLFVLIGIGGIVLAVSLPPNAKDTVGPLVGIGCAGLFVVWIIIAVICQNTTIRPKEITNTHMTLTGVSDLFVDAVEDAKAEHRSRRRSRVSRLEEDEDEEEAPPPRKKRPPSDAYEA